MFAVVLLITPTAKTDGAVNGGRSPFILPLTGSAGFAICIVFSLFLLSFNHTVMFHFISISISHFISCFPKNIVVTDIKITVKTTMTNTDVNTGIVEAVPFRII